jgi:hypothetical protein
MFGPNKNSKVCSKKYIGFSERALPYFEEALSFWHSSSVIADKSYC